MFTSYDLHQCPAGRVPSGGGGIERLSTMQSRFFDHVNFNYAEKCDNHKIAVRCFFTASPSGRPELPSIRTLCTRRRKEQAAFRARGGEGHARTGGLRQCGAFRRAFTSCPAVSVMIHPQNFRRRPKNIRFRPCEIRLYFRGWAAGFRYHGARGEACLSAHAEF